MVAQIARARESKQGNFTERNLSEDSGKAARISISLTRHRSGVFRQKVERVERFYRRRKKLITKISLDHFELLATTMTLSYGTS